MAANEDRAVRIAARLLIGECYVQGKLIPRRMVTREAVSGEKRKIKQTFSTIKKRAVELTSNAYEYQGLHTYTDEFDIIVFGVLIRVRPSKKDEL